MPLGTRRLKCIEVQLIPESPGGCRPWLVHGRFTWNHVVGSEALSGARVPGPPGGRYVGWIYGAPTCRDIHAAADPYIRESTCTASVSRETGCTGGNL